MDNYLEDSMAMMKIVRQGMDDYKNDRANPSEKAQKEIFEHIEALGDAEES